MGILNGPRINFWGGIQTNVCVANNDDAIPQKRVPVPGQAHILDLAAAQIGADGQSMTDDALIELIRKPMHEGKTAYYTGGGWNYYGDHQVRFDDAIVSSTGAPGAVTTSGSIVNQPIYLLGSVDPVTGEGPYMSSVMVDLDPTASISTQIFIGGLMIGSPSNPLLHLVENVVASSYSVFTVGSQNGQQMPIIRQFYRDPDGPGSAWASGTFQVTFKNTPDVVKAADTSDPAIAAIINDPNIDGIVLRFQMFEMFPELTTQELVTAYQNNQNPSNPSVGRVVGTIAPRYAGEPETCSPGRELVMADTNLTGYFDVDASNKRLSLDALALYPKGYFRNNRKNIGSGYPIEDNVDYGTNTLSAGTESVTFLAGPDNYYKYGGILDIDLGSKSMTSAVQNNAVSVTGANSVTLPAVGTQVAAPLGWTSGNTTSFSASETVIRIYGDERNIYLDDHGGSLQVTMQIRELGGPVSSAITVDFSQVQTGTLPVGGYLNTLSPVQVASGDSDFSFTICDNGNIDKFGFETIVLSQGSNPLHFLNVRKYPWSDFGIQTGSTISWPQVYENALRFYYITFPAMNMRFPLNDEGTIKAMSSAIKARTDTASANDTTYRPTTLYMPITRSMTPSQRTLLVQFLDGKPWTPLSLIITPPPS